MQDHGAWDEWARLQRFLAEQLCSGRLALALGAGVSVPFGLPGWGQLTEAAFKQCGGNRSPNQSDEEAAEELFVTHCSRNRMKFAELIRQILYDGVDLSMEALSKRDLLAAIGSLTMASSRGNVKSVLTFNFDDLVERFLTYYGHFIESVAAVPAWGGRFDARIFHIHGLLPSDAGAMIPGPIVMTQADFDEITGKDANVWRALMVHMFRTHTCMFIGLSGKDQNLFSAVKEINKVHPARERGDAYWGVRFCLQDDPLITHWHERGVYCVKLLDYSVLPSKLFALSQTASDLWRKRYA